MKNRFENNFERKENPSISVWIIDDDEAIRDSLVRYLHAMVAKDIKLSVEQFSDGESAIKKLDLSGEESSKPDVISLDGDLGDGRMGGGSVAREIAGRSGAIIVAMSSSEGANKQIEQAALSVGGRTVIVGKDRPVGLVRIINEAISRGDFQNKKE